MNITFISRYGSKNIGDELIVRELEKLLIESNGNLKRFDFSLNNYKNLNAAFIEKTEKTEKKNVKDQSIYRKYLREFFLVAIARDILNKRRAKRNNKFKNFRRKLKQSNLLIIGGGNAIYDTEKYSSSYYYFDLLLREATKLKVPIYVLNIGVGPFHTEKQHKRTIKVLKKADFITVRDEESYRLLKKINKNKKKLYKTIDPVLLLNNKNYNSNNVVKSIGITIMDLRLADYTEREYINYINGFKLLISYLLTNSDYKINVFCTEEKDIYALNDLKKELNDKKENINLLYQTNTNLSEVLKSYDSIDLLIGTRMHSTIIAFSQGIPFIGIDWQQKVKGFFETINYEHNLLELDDFTKDFKIAVKKIDVITKNYKLERDYLLEKKDELYPIYQINSKILKKFSSE